MKVYLTCGVLLLLTSTYVFAQSATDIKFEHFSVERGLSNSSVLSILQDSKGYMWLGTRDGLNRFNGYEFKVFQYEKKNNNSISNSWVNCLNEDKEGNIWIGTLNGICLYDPIQDKITRLIGRVDSYDFNFPSTAIWNIQVFKDSTVWIGTGTGIYIINPKSHKVKSLLMEAGNSNSLNSNTVHDIAEGRDGIIYIATNQDQLLQYDRKTATFGRISYKQTSSVDNFKKTISIDVGGRLWIGAQGSGIHIYNPETRTTIYIGEGEGKLNSLNTIGGVLFIDRYAWIACDGGGINIYNRDTEEMTYVVNDPKNKFSLSTNGTYCLYKDRNDIIWVGLYGGGVNVIDKYKWKFTSYKHNPEDPFSISENPVLSVFQDSKQRVWVGTDGGGLNQLDPNTGKFTHIRRDPTKSNTLSTNVIVSINEDNFGNILLGTYAGGLMSFNPENEKIITFKPIIGDPNSISSQHVWTILRDKKDQIWLGLLTTALDKYIPETQTFKNYSQESAGTLRVENGNVMHITMDNIGRLWLGGEGLGLVILDEAKNQSIVYKNKPDNDNSLSNDDIKCIVFDKGYAWIATNGGGLDRFDLETKEFKHYTRDEGLPSNSVMGILKDDKQNLWVSTTKGLFKFNLDTEEITLFDKNDGLQGDEFKYNAQFKLKNGKMLFGGIDGLTIFSPDSVRPNPIMPPIVFTDFRVNNKPVDIGAKKSPLARHIDETEYVVLNHKQSVFTINYAALNYTASEKNLYKYMMEGFDDEWVDAGKNRSVTYTNLDAGRYTFKVIASNNDGLWNDTGRSFRIRIKPAWWETWWFYSIIFGMVLAAIYAFIKWREEQAKQDKLILEEKIQEGKKLIDEKVREVELQKEEIRLRDLEERNMHWHNEGLNMFSEIISKNKGSLQILSSTILTKLIEYLGANLGALFLLDDEIESDQYLKLQASYSYPLSDNDRNSFRVGEAQVGICFLENKIIEYNEIPESYIKIGSGLGESVPRYLVLIPINLDQIKIGVIEIASFNKLEPHKIKFVQKLNETLTSILGTEKANARMKELLDRMNTQAEELKAQEEEMRQNLEEMQATQEEAQRREDELLAKIKEKDELLAKSKKQTKK